VPLLTATHIRLMVFKPSNSPTALGLSSSRLQHRFKKRCCASCTPGFLDGVKSIGYTKLGLAGSKYHAFMPFDKRNQGKLASSLPFTLNHLIKSAPTDVNIVDKDIESGNGDPHNSRCSSRVYKAKQKTVGEVRFELTAWNAAGVGRNHYLCIQMMLCGKYSLLPEVSHRRTSVWRAYFHKNRGLDIVHRC